jgi:hypothetical protein
MLPVLTFVAGIAAGALGVQMLKKSKAPAKLTDLAHKARSGFDKAGEDLRDVTVSGLSAVEKSSANLRAKLVGEPEPNAAAPTDDSIVAEAELPAAVVKPRSTQRRRKNEKA